MSAREDLHQLVDALPEDVLLRVTGSVSEPNDERQLRQISLLVEKAAAPAGGTLRQRGGRLVPAPWKSRHRLAAGPDQTVSEVCRNQLAGSAGTKAPLHALPPAPRRAMLRATPRGATDGPPEPPPLRAERGRRRAGAAGGVWAATVAGRAAGQGPTHRGALANYGRSERRRQRGIPPGPARPGLFR